MVNFTMLALWRWTCLCALVLLVPPSLADETVGEAGSDDPAILGQHASRKLLQNNMNTCQYDFSKVDFSSVTSVCKGPDYDAKTCCEPFTKLACQYKPQINDFNSLCPIYFLSYLDVAGGYMSGVFVGDGRCNNGNQLCSE